MSEQSGSLGGAVSLPRNIFSFAVSQKVSPMASTKSTKIVIFLNLHFNVSDPREEFFSYKLPYAPPLKISPRIYTFLTGAFSFYKMPENRQKPDKSHP